MCISTFLAFALYLAILISIGIFTCRKQHSAKDYLLGGRSLNFWTTALSAHASDMSNWLFMGYPAAIYSYGLVEGWTAIGLFIGMFLSWQYIAPNLRIKTEEYEVLTLSSYFAKHFNDTSGTLRLLTAVISLVFFIFYITAGLRGMGMVIEMAFGIDYAIGITISTIIVVLYTMIGGFTGVAYSDMFQALFLLFVILFVAFYSSVYTDSISQIWSVALSKNISLSLIPDYSTATLLTGLTTAGNWGLGYFGQPHILNKFMSIDDPDKIKKAKIIGMIWQALTLGAATIIGLLSVAYFAQGLANPELIFITMVKQLFNPFYAGIILCAILAAIISTIDSQALVFASVISQDIYKPYKQTATEQELIWISRISVLLVCTLAYSIAFFEIRTVYSLVKYAWSGLGSSFGPLLLFSLYSKRITHTGAFAGILVGAITSAVWPSTDFLCNQTPMIPGFILSLVALYSVSFLKR